MYARGILNALASGNLIYIALVEMLNPDMSDPVVQRRPRLKLCMTAAACVGAASMAILAIWA